MLFLPCGGSIFVKRHSRTSRYIPDHARRHALVVRSVRSVRTDLLSVGLPVTARAPRVEQAADLRGHFKVGHLAATAE
jgi:hypothetical protein